jgi:signal transduction histidine kinase
MSKKWRLTDRTRTLLTLELAIVLPAAALMAFSVWNLKHIQRDRAIEAAIQRDFSYVLKIAEKKSWVRANDLLVPIRKEFPNSGDSAKVKSDLARVLSAHPELAYVAYYDKTKNLFASAMQPARGEDMAFCARAEENIKMIEQWFPVEAPEFVGHLRLMAEQDEPPVGFYGGWTIKDNLRSYWNVAYFLPTEVAKDRVTLGVASFDEDYLRKNFFPAVIKDTLTSKSSVMRSDANPPAMMIHSTKDPNPWVASPNWDGGKPEVERNLGEVLGQGFVVAIKYPGTTIADIGAKFLRYNYTILGALSLLMVGGIFLSYRNVSREMNLARLKSDFVANVSHELRTPLALIRLYAETLELGRLTAKDKYQEYFRIIREESERLTALINNILDFSRIEAGRKEYEFKETNLPDLVRSTLDSYRFQIEQNGFAFEENISRDIPPVNVDREAIARSLLNLVNNALKYSKDKKFICVSLYRTNGSVKLEVRDHGIGIPPSEQEKIFEKFYRCGDPLVHNIKGSGLGLSLVRHIVRAHGGDVQVESTPEKGSKFTIALPLDPSSRTGAAVA